MTSTYSTDADKGLTEIEISQENVNDLNCQPINKILEIPVKETSNLPRTEIDDPCLYNVILEDTQTENKQSQTIDEDGFLHDGFFPFLF